MFLFYKREGLKGVKSMSFDFSGWGAGEVLLAMMLSSKIIVVKPLKIIAGLQNKSGGRFGGGLYSAPTLVDT